MFTQVFHKRKKQFISHAGGGSAANPMALSILEGPVDPNALPRNTAIAPQALGRLALWVVCENHVMPHILAFVRGEPWPADARGPFAKRTFGVGMLIMLRRGAIFQNPGFPGAP